MEKLQYTALCKCTGAVSGARREAVRKVAAVESVEMFACATAERLLAWTMCDPDVDVVEENRDGALMDGGDLSLGGPCWKGEIQGVNLRIST